MGIDSTKATNLDPDQFQPDRSQPSHSRAPDSGLRGSISVTDYGAKGDGTTDDTDAIQGAIDHVAGRGGGTVYIPGVPKFYRTTKPIICRNRVRITGDGFSSHIWNVQPRQRDLRPDRARFSTMTFAAGCFAKHDIALLTKYPVVDAHAVQPIVQPGPAMDVLRGSNKVSVSLPSSDSGIEIGEIICLMADDSVAAPNSPSEPSYVAFNRVIDIESAQDLHVLTLQHPLQETVASLKIGRWINMGEIPGSLPRFILDQGELSHLRVSCNDSGWAQRMGCYECVFQDLYIQKSESMLVANGFAYCLASGFRGNFGRNAISTAVGSSNSIISNFVGTQVFNGTVDPDAIGSSYSLVNIHEGSRNILVTGLELSTLRVPEGTLSKIVNIQGCQIKVADSSFSSPVNATAIGIVSAGNGGTAEYLLDDNVISNCRFQLGGGTAAILKFECGSAGHMNVVENCQFMKSGADYAIKFDAARRNIVRNSYFESGDVSIAAEARRIAIEDCEFGSEIKIEDNAPDSSIMRIRTPKAGNFLKLRQSECDRAKITSTTSVPDWRVDIPPGTLAKNDRVIFDYWAELLGRKAGKTLEIRIQDSISQSIRATTERTIRIRITLDARGPRRQNWLLEWWVGDAYRSIAITSTSDCDKAVVSTGVNAFVDNAEDSVQRRGFIVTPIRKYLTY